MNNKLSLTIKSNDHYHYGVYTIVNMRIEGNDNIEFTYGCHSKNYIDHDKKMKIIGTTHTGENLRLTSYDTFESAKGVIDTFERLLREKSEEIFVLPSNK